MWTNARKLAGEARARGAMQKVDELAPLLDLLKRRSPRTVVEIGTARGGTLYAWCRVARPDASWSASTCRAVRSAAVTGRRSCPG